MQKLQIFPQDRKIMLWAICVFSWWWLSCCLCGPSTPPFTLICCSVSSLRFSSLSAWFSSFFGCFKVSPWSVRFSWKCQPVEEDINREIIPCNLSLPSPLHELSLSFLFSTITSSLKWSRVSRMVALAGWGHWACDFVPLSPGHLSCYAFPVTPEYLVSPEVCCNINWFRKNSPWGDHKWSGSSWDIKHSEDTYDWYFGLFRGDSSFPLLLGTSKTHPYIGEFPRTITR